MLAGIVAKLALADGAHPMIEEAHNITVRNRMNNFFKVLSPIVKYYCTFWSIPDLSIYSRLVKNGLLSVDSVAIAAATQSATPTIIMLAITA